MASFRHLDVWSGSQNSALIGESAKLDTCYSKRSKEKQPRLNSHASLSLSLSLPPPYNEVSLKYSGVYFMIRHCWGLLTGKYKILRYIYNLQSDYITSTIEGKARGLCCLD
jgi:hypothetical protein